MHTLRFRRALHARAVSHALAAVAGLACVVGSASAQIAPIAAAAPAAVASGSSAPPAQVSSLEKAPQSAAMADSVVTVDTLVRSENQQALARAREQAVASGLIEAPRPATSSAPMAARLTVISIFGIEGNLRANLYFNGEPYEGLRVGSPIGGCVVASIAPRSVALAPKGRGVELSKSASANCPKAVWTGMPPPELAAMARNALQASLAKQASGGAMPSPAIPAPFGGQPAAGAATGSNSLIPRQTEAVRDPRLEPASSGASNTN